MTFEISEANDPDILQTLYDGLDAYNEGHCERGNYRPYQIVLRDDAGVVRAASLGHTIFRWMSVRYVWVDAALRGQGTGRELLAAVEDHARTIGCVGMKVNTFSFQARGFYEKQGFACYGTLEGYPPGHACHYLSKTL